MHAVFVVLMVVGIVLITLGITAWAIKFINFPDDPPYK